MKRALRNAAEDMARRCVAQRARRLCRVITRIYDDALRPQGMRAAQLNVLVAAALVGPVRPVDLGKHLDLDKSTLSRNLQRLVDAGWLALAKASSGSGQVATLTDAGEVALRAAYPAWKKAQARAAALVGNDVVSAIDRLKAT